MSDIQKNVVAGKRKGYQNYLPEFKQCLMTASCEPGDSISNVLLQKSEGDKLIAV